MTDRADAAAEWVAKLNGKVARERRAKLAAMRREQKLRRELRQMRRIEDAWERGWERAQDESRVASRRLWSVRQS